MINLCQHYIDEKCVKVEKYVREAIVDEKQGREDDALACLQAAYQQVQALEREIKQGLNALAMR